MEKVTNFVNLLEAWMFDIVNNQRNSIDVDKFDYLRRDTHKLGVSLQGYDD